MMSNSLSPTPPPEHTLGMGIWPARPGIGGHRGLGRTDSLPPKAGHPDENTLASIRSAFEAGADYCELDVVFTADGDSVLLHSTLLDPHFFTRKHLTGSRVSDLSWDELRDLPVGISGTGQLALLSEALALCTQLADRHAPFVANIELKGQQSSGAPWDGPELCQSVYQAVKQSECSPERLLFSSFCLANLSEMAALLPESRYGMLFGTASCPEPLYSNRRSLAAFACLPFDLDHLERCIFEIGAKQFSGLLEFVHPEISTLSLPTLLRLSDFGIHMNAWDSQSELTDDRKALYRLAAKNCDELGIACSFITDDIQNAIQVFPHPQSPSTPFPENP